MIAGQQQSIAAARNAVVDFDVAARDPANPNTLLTSYDSGDNLHPSDAGYRVMANAFDLVSIKNPCVSKQVLRTPMCTCSRRHDGHASASYVALGSSFAAGLGLGPRLPHQPLTCQRTANGYPQQLARLCGLELDDRTCSGATTAHVLGKGPLRQAPQIDTLGPQTRLVTLSIGGNDLRYVGDLTMLGFRNRNLFWRALMAVVFRGPAKVRDFAGLHRDLTAILAEVKRRAPEATVALVSYPQILPPTGTNTTVGINEAEAAAMRLVALQLDDVTRLAAAESGVLLVDMERISEGHHAGSAEPWVNGVSPASGAPFHPTVAGAAATARAVAKAVGLVPTLLEQNDVAARN